MRRRSATVTGCLIIYLIGQRVAGFRGSLDLVTTNRGGTTMYRLPTIAAVLALAAWREGRL